MRRQYWSRVQEMRTVIERLYDYRFFITTPSEIYWSTFLNASYANRNLESQ